MSKVLFINNYYEGTGYSNAGIDFILALDAAGVNVVPKALRLSGNRFPIPERVKELEKNDDKNASINIQYTLPSLMYYNGNYKNVGMFELDVNQIPNSWSRNLKLMDVVIGTNSHQLVACDKKGLKLSKIPHPTNVKKYQQSYEKFNIPILKDKFVFYFIGELNKRKNLSALLQAFHLEFKPNEPVEIVIKAHIPGKNSEFNRIEVDKYCAEVKKGMKLYASLDRYKKEIIIPEYISDDDIMKLHSTCDCFVMPSYGEGWSKPTFDAMAMGKTPIVNNVGGMKEDITEQNGWLCENTEENCFGCVDNGIELFNSKQTWNKINIQSLRKAMREAYENKGLKEAKSERGMEDALEYSYLKVGNKFRELLNV